MDSRELRQLQNSKIRTEHSVIDGSVSLRQDIEDNKNTEQFSNLLKWINKRMSVGQNIESLPLFKPKIQAPIPVFSYYLVKLQSIQQLNFHKRFPQSKVYVHLTAKLLNSKSLTQYNKIIKIVKILDETGTYSFEMKEGICFYFYTSREQQINFRLQVVLSEFQARGQDIPNSFGSTDNKGFFEINFAKEKRIKQKKRINSPCDRNLPQHANQQSAEGSSYPIAIFSVMKSDVYKFLEKTIPENVLCDSCDRIPGILGSFLPATQNALSNFTLSPQAQSLRLQIMSVQLSSQIMKQAQLIGDGMVSRHFTSASKVSCTLGQLILNVCFHNGWKRVSSGCSLLKQKQELRFKTNQSNLSDVKQNNFNPISHRKSKEQIKPVQRNKNINKYYICEKPIQLALIFPNDEECAIIFEIQVKIIIKGEFPQIKEVKPDPLRVINEQLNFPLCFALVSGKVIDNFKFSSSQFYRGSALGQIDHLINMIKKREAVQKQYKNKKQNNRMLNMSKLRVPSAFDMQNISIAKTIKTVENISQTSLKNRSQLGHIQFQMQVRDMQVIAGMQTNNSLIFQNFSVFNMSKGDGKDNIALQKERILKQQKKTTTNIKMTLQLTKRVTFTEQQKMEIRSNNAMRTAKIINQQKIKLLQYLRQQAKNRQNQGDKINKYLNWASLDKQPKPILSNAIQTYYNISLCGQQLSMDYQIQKMSPLMQLLYSNNLSNVLRFNQFEHVPIQIIRTQMSQINFSNCFFFNFQSISGDSHQVTKIPNIFYFHLRLWNKHRVMSQLLTIDKDTGEITLWEKPIQKIQPKGINRTSQKGLFKEEKQKQKQQIKNSKVMHLEITFDELVSSHQISFIHFVQYLYNGTLNIEMVDYLTGLTYGEIVVPLRPLIRKRRNEALYIHDDFIYHRHSARAKIKLQIRAIRKTKNKVIAIQQNVEQKQMSIETQQERIKNRINKFKQAKDKINQGVSDIVEKNRKISDMMNLKYGTDRIHLHVTTLKKYFFFVEVVNIQSKKILLRFDVLDEHQKWIALNPLSGQDQISLVRDVSLLERQDLQVISTSRKNSQKLSKCLKGNSDYVIELQPKQKGTLLLCYMSVRGYHEWQETDNDEMLTIYNRQRLINCSLIDQSNSNVHSIYRVQVQPLPDEQPISIQLYRPSGERSPVHIPFINTKLLEQRVDQILSDDPFVVMYATDSVKEVSVIGKKLAAPHSGLVILVNSDIGAQQCKDINLLVLNNSAKKMRVVGESRRLDRSKIKEKSRMSIQQNYQYFLCGANYIRISLKVWACQKIEAKADLWKLTDIVFWIKNSIFSQKSNRNKITHFYLFSDDESTVKFHQLTKQKHESYHFLKVTELQSSTQIMASITPQRTGHSYIHINAIDANSIIDQQQKIQYGQFSQTVPFYRLVLCLTASVPNFKEIMKININRNTQVNILEEPFCYRSNVGKKMEFQVLTSDSRIVWLKSSDYVFQLQSRAERKITVKFNVGTILQQNSSGISQSVIMGIKWDAGIDYFGFRFNIY